MKENTQDKMMVKVNENNIFYNIKMFLRKLFNKTSNDIEKSNEIRKQKLLEYRKKYKQIIKKNRYLFEIIMQTV